MSKPKKILAFFLLSNLGLPGFAAVISTRQNPDEQTFIYKSAPAHSGIYNLRRPASALPNPRNSMHRKPRLKPASDSVAVLR